MMSFGIDSAEVAMSDENRPPLPYAFFPPVATFVIDSDDLTDGEPLGNDQVFDQMGLSGKNRSPQIAWRGFPPETKSFALTCFDPDAPTGSGFWHWVVVDLAATVTSLPAGASNESALPPGAFETRNDYGTAGFGGAAPPPGDPPHRYVFTVHALDVETLGLDASVSPAIVGFNLRFHAIARAQLVATYAR
jgi:Raf kinase inhibitor-like YbhB/YbcL family protein